MINLLYQLTSKGLYKALSFFLATLVFGVILIHSNLFAHYFGGKIPFLALLVFYAMTILWIHGVGFIIRTKLWKVVFLPLIGYLIIILSFIYVALIYYELV